MSVIGKLKEEACPLKCGNTVEVDFAIEDENGGDATDPGELQADAQDLADAIAAQAFASSVFDGGASCHKPKSKVGKANTCENKTMAKRFRGVSLCIARCGFGLAMLHSHCFPLHDVASASRC